MIAGGGWRWQAVMGHDLRVMSATTMVYNDKYSFSKFRGKKCAGVFHISTREYSDVQMSTFYKVVLENLTKHNFAVSKFQIQKSSKQPD